MTITAQVEGVGNLEFPDGTDPSVIQATVRRLVAQRGAGQQQQPKPLGQPEPVSGFDRALASLPSGLVNNPLVTKAKSFVTGMADPVVGTAQLGANMLPDSTGIPQQVNQAIAEKGRALESERGKDAGFDLTRMAGNVLSPVNLAIALKMPMVASTLGRAGQGAGIGAGTAAMAPVEGADSDFARKKVMQIGTGAVTGGVATPVLGKVADFVARRINVGNIDAGKVKAEADALISDALKEVGQKVDDLPRVQYDALRQQVADSLKSGKELDAAALLRKQDFEAENIPHTLGQITRDPTQFARERNLRGVQGIGEPLMDVFNEGNRSLTQKVGQFGATANDALTAGERIAGALRSIDKGKQEGVSALYREARASAGKDLDVPLTGLAQDYASVLDRFGDKVPSGVKNQFNKLGLDPANPTNQKKTFTIEDADKLLKVINDHWENGPDSGAVRAALGELNRSVKGAVTAADSTGGPFAPAVKAAAERFALQDAVPALEAAAKGAQSDKFVQKFVIGGNTREVQQMASLLRKESPEAFDEARAQIGEQLTRAAFGENVTGDKLFRPEMYAKALRQLGKEKLSAFFEPQEIEQLTRLGRIGAYQNSIPGAAAVNMSNTGSAMANLANKGGSIAMGALPYGRDVQALAQAAKTAINNGRGVREAVEAAVPMRDAAALSPAQRRLIAEWLAGGAGATGLALAPGFRPPAQ